MPSFRASRFLENFDPHFDDDSSESPSPESFSTASSPELTPLSSSFPTQLMQMFSNMGLRHTTPRVSRQDNGTASQAQTPAPPQTTAQMQTHAPAQTFAASPDNEHRPVDMPSQMLTTVLDESSLPDPMLDVDETKESSFDESTTTSARIGDEEQITVDAQILPEKPSTSIEMQPELESGVASEKTEDPSSSDNVPEQTELPTTTQSESTKTAKAIIDDLVQECLMNTKEHRTISRKFDRLVENLQSFRQTRDTEALKFQNCYSSHSRNKTSPAKCVDCFLRIKDLEDRYLQAYASIRKMMEELCECISASVMRANMRQKIRTRLEAEMVGDIYLYEENLSKLEETERMLQSLEDDAEAAKGWPQVFLGDGPFGNDQAPKNANEGDDAGTDDTESSQVKSRKGKSKVQKKKKGKR